MKNFGLCLIIAGAIWGVVAFNMKSTVETESRIIGSGLYSTYIPSQTVHNLDLADQRRNHLIGAGLSLISGILLFGFGSLMPNENESAPANKKCPFCAESIKREAAVCHYCSNNLPKEPLILNEGLTHRKELSSAHIQEKPLTNLIIKVAVYACFALVGFFLLSAFSYYYYW